MRKLKFIEVSTAEKMRLDFSESALASHAHKSAMVTMRDNLETENVTLRELREKVMAEIKDMQEILSATEVEINNNNVTIKNLNTILGVENMVTATDIFRQKIQSEEDK